MRFTLVRHGETIQNKDQIIQGHLPGELSEHGKSQVRKTARELASTHFDHIYSSDLNRCKQTANILRKHHEDTEITYDERLRETFFGDWEGLPYKDGMWHGQGGKNLDMRPPGGESIKELHTRAVECINEILTKHKKDDHVLIVSHGGTLRTLVAIYNKVKFPNIWIIKFNNAQTYIMDLDKPLENKLEVID